MARTSPPRVLALLLIAALLLLTALLPAHGMSNVNREEEEEEESGFGETEYYADTMQIADFQKSVMESRDVWLVAYYGVSDPKDNTALKTTLSAMLQSLEKKVSQYGIKVGTIDCTDRKQGRALCKTSAIRMLPTLALFTDDATLNPYSKKMYRPSKIFGGGHPDSMEGKNPGDARHVESFIGKNYPADLIDKVDVDDDGASGAGLARVQALLAGSSLPVALIFTERKSSTMLLKSTAVHYRGQITFVEVSSAAVSAVQAFGVTQYPSVVVLDKPSEISAFAVYDEASGIKERNGLIAVLARHAAELPSTKAGAGSSQKQESSSGKQQQESSKSDAREGPNDSVFADPKAFSLASLSADAAWILAVVQSDAAAEIGPEWARTKKWADGAIRTAELRCSAEADAEVGAELGVKLCARGPASKLPYLLNVPHGSSARKKLDADPAKWKRIMYLGDEIEDARKASGDSLPDTSVHEVHEDGLDQFVAMHYQRGVLPLIIISDKATPASMLKNLGLHLGKYVAVGFLSNPGQAFMESLGNPALPTAIGAHFLPDDSRRGEIQIALYDQNHFGPMRFGTLQNFALTIFSRSGLAQAHQEAESSSGGSGASDDIKGSAQSDVVLLSSPPHWEEECSSSFRGICAVGFAAGAFGQAAGDAAADTMHTVLRSLGGSAAAFKVMAVDASCQGSFADAFGIQYSDAPTVAVYSPSKKRYATFRGSFSDSAVKDFLEKVLRGTVATAPLSQRPVMSAECDGTGAEELAPDSLGAEEADDFLAEIRKEEEERKKALKREIEEEKRAEAEAKKAAEEAAKKKKSKKKKSKKKKGTKSEL